MEHATVRLADYEVPLIGIPKDATQETCDGCGKTFHLSELELDEKGNPKCLKCRTVIADNDSLNWILLREGQS